MSANQPDHAAAPRPEEIAGRLAEQREHAEWLVSLNSRDMDGISAVNITRRLLDVLDLAAVLLAERQQLVALADSQGDLIAEMRDWISERQQLREALEAIIAEAMRPRDSMRATQYRERGENMLSIARAALAVVRDPAPPPAPGVLSDANAANDERNDWLVLRRSKSEPGDWLLVGTFQGSTASSAIAAAIKASGLRREVEPEEENLYAAFCWQWARELHGSWTASAHVERTVEGQKSA